MVEDEMVDEKWDEFKKYIEETIIGPEKLNVIIGAAIYKDWLAEHAHALPATDPAFVLGPNTRDGTAEWPSARLSVADGPGPKERPGFCGSCGTPDHYAGDRTHPCASREEQTR